ncbi:MAG: hypothetical protein MUC92_14020 [Fimbriimonadaceae bacterium]|nr:hypothetical protein [Fimbriimonadaceae bacterium]
MVANNEWKEAARECLTVLRADPDHLGALEVYAQALWFGSDFGQVVKVTSHLLRLNPHEPGYRYTRGMARMSLGALHLAAEDFRMALSQSRDEKFRSQVSQSLQAVELWMEDSLEQPGFDQSPSVLRRQAGLRGAIYH